MEGYGVFTRGDDKFEVLMNRLDNDDVFIGKNKQTNKICKITSSNNIVSSA